MADTTPETLGTLKLKLLHDVLFQKAEAFISDSKDQDTTSDDYLSNFSYLFLDRGETNDLEELRPIIELLLSPEHREVMELNLALANVHSDWKAHPIEWAIADYLNDFLNYVIPRIVNLEDWRIGFEKEYGGFEIQFLSDQITVEFFGNLGNFYYRFSDTGELNDHTKIVVLNGFSPPTKDAYWCNKKADFLRVRSALVNGFPQIDEERWKKQSNFLHYTKKFSKKPSQNPRFDTYELMRKFVLGVRVLSPSPGKPYCNFAVAFFPGSLSGGFHSEAATFPEGTIDEDRGVNFEYGTWLRRLWEKLEDIDYSQKLIALDHHLDDSFRRGFRSARNPYARRLQLLDELERLSDYFSAFDSIYKTKPGKTKEMISKLTGRLMTYKRNPQDQRDPSQFNQVKKFVETMYDIRGAYEHGRIKDALKNAGKPEQFEEKVRTIGWYLKEVAIVYIMNDDFETQIPKIETGDCSGLKSIYY